MRKTHHPRATATAQPGPPVRVRHSARLHPSIGALIATAGIAAGTVATPATAQASSGQAVPTFKFPGGFAAISAPSANDVWAVGAKELGALAAHFNGRAWTTMPVPANSHGLIAVAATSASNVWASSFTNKATYQIVHWNGKSWAAVASPQRILGMTAISPSNVWGVGQTADGTTLLAHWNGTAWKQVPSPPGRGSLNAVTAVSANDIWAVGATSGGKPLIIHWNGSAWSNVAAPSGGGQLMSVSAAGRDDAWAVGGSRPLHWNGTSWKLSPLTAGVHVVAAAVSGSRAWGVGQSTKSSKLAVVRWNGSKWSKVATPSAGGQSGSELIAVVSLSARDAWAVGVAWFGSDGVILHWNGTSWKFPGPGYSK